MRSFGVWKRLNSWRNAYSKIGRSFSSWRTGNGNDNSTSVSNWTMAQQIISFHFICTIGCAPHGDIECLAHVLSPESQSVSAIFRRIKNKNLPLDIYSFHVCADGIRFAQSTTSPCVVRAECVSGSDWILLKHKKGMEQIKYKFMDRHVLLIRTKVSIVPFLIFLVYFILCILNSAE